MSNQSLTTKEKRKDNLQVRTLNIINKNGYIFLKRKDGWYMQHYSNLAAGPDYLHWGKRPVALEFFNLEIAFAIAKLYDCKVVSFYPRRLKNK